LNAAKNALSVTFDIGERHELAAEYLRVESPSAEVQGHSAAQRQTVPGKRHVKIARLEPVGHYALRIASTTAMIRALHWAYLLSWAVSARKSGPLIWKSSPHRD
jgi:DUF971 family protein